MAEGDASGEPDLVAGPFSSWLAEVRGAIRERRTSHVPCGDCTACCRSSQFVHIEPHETDTLSHIPAQLLFPAPGLPPGHALLGYDEHGHCPMLSDNRCSIYEHRPKTCRTYDCRIFPAAGIDIVDDKELITQRARRWRFTFRTPEDRAQHDAVRAATTFLGEHEDLLPNTAAPLNATQHAVLAIDISDAFLGRDGRTGEVTVAEPDADVVRVEIRRRTRARQAP
jgi:Fe-S-cluster containining protein